MAKIVFRLRSVPVEEAEAVRELLTREQISWYETTAGNWGISNPAIWVHNDEDLERARVCIEEYQQQLASNQTGQTPDLLTHIRENYLAIVLACAVVATILYFSIAPFFELFVETTVNTGVSGINQDVTG